MDFGEAVGVIDGARRKMHFFCMDLPQSDACYVKAYPAETTEGFLDGYVSAFAFFGGMPLSILYNNTKIAVARICGDGKRSEHGRSRGLSAIIFSPIALVRLGRGTTRGRSKAWSSTPDRTSWCRSSMRSASMTSAFDQPQGGKAFSGRDGADDSFCRLTVGEVPFPLIPTT